MSGSYSGVCCAAAKQHCENKRNSFVTVSFEIYFIILELLYLLKVISEIFQELRSAQGSGQSSFIDLD